MNDVIVTNFDMKPAQRDEISVVSDLSDIVKLGWGAGYELDVSILQVNDGAHYALNLTGQGYRIARPIEPHPPFSMSDVEHLVALRDRCTSILKQIAPEFA